MIRNEANLAVARLEFLRLRVKGGGDFREQRIAGVDHRSARGRTHTARSRGTAGSSGRRILRVADVELDVLYFQAKSVGCNHSNAGTGAGPDVDRKSTRLN